MKPPDTIAALRKILDAREATIRNLQKRTAGETVRTLPAPQAPDTASIYGLPAAGLHAQELELDILNRVIPHLEHRTFLDIGAEQGNLSRSFIKAGLTGHLFEPFTRHAPALQALVAGTPSVFHALAIDEHDHRAELHLATNQAGEPIPEFNSLHKFAGKDARISQRSTETVECRSVRSLIADGSIPPAVGLVKTDTEGNDAAVLRGMPPQYCEVLCCEYFTEGLYAGWDQGHPRGLLELARQLGFEHYAAVKHRADLTWMVLGPTAFAPQTWGNLVFVRPVIWHACLPSWLELIHQSDLANSVRHEAQREEYARLAVISKEREQSLIESSSEANRLRIDAANLTTELKAKERDLLAAHAEMKQLATTAGQRERSLLESSAEADRLRVSAATLTAELLAKEAVIRDLVRACDERLQLINKLTAGQARGPQ